MKRTMMTLAGLALLLGGVRPLQAGSVGYDLQVTAIYQFGAPPGAIRYGGSPDTSFFQITNLGSSTFSGTIGQVAQSHGAGDFSYSVSGITLAAGQSSAWFGTSWESSNYGGFNGQNPDGTQQGIQVYLNGTVSGQAGSENVNLSVYDSQIHSGVFRTNPYGVTLDNYILQGGDPYGRDTGDGFENSQAPGHYTWSEQGPGPALTPEPSSFALLGSLSVSLAGCYGWRRRKLIAA